MIIIFFSLYLLYLCPEFSSFACRDHAVEGDAAFFEGVIPPRAAHVEEPLKEAEEVTAQQLMEELAVAAKRQTELVTQLKARYVGEGSSLAQKEEEIALLKAHLADVESTTAHARKLADEKLSLMVEVNQERSVMQQYRTSFSWGLKYLQEKKGEHFENLDRLRAQGENALKVQEGKLRKLSIEYDEELYPHLMSVIAERRYASLIFSTIFFLASFVIC